MGASNSAEPKLSPEQREAESIAASTGALPMLQKAFSKLANPESNTVPLQNLQVLLLLILIKFLALDCYHDLIFEIVNSLVSAMLRFESRRWKLQYRECTRFVSSVVGSVRFISG